MKRALLLGFTKQKQDKLIDALFVEKFTCQFKPLTGHIDFASEVDNPHLMLIHLDHTDHKDQVVIQHIMSNTELNSIPVLGYTSTKKEDHLAEWISAGVSDFVFPDMSVQEMRIRLANGYKCSSLTHENTQLFRSLKETTRTEQWFKKALTNSQIVISSQDTEGRYTWIFNPNPGFRPESILGKRDADIYSEKDALTLKQLKQRVLQSGQAERKEISLTINHLKYSYDLTVEPIIENDIIVGVTCLSMDITEFKSLLERVTFSEDRYFKIFDLSPNGILLLDDKGNIIEANSSFCHMLGYEKRELINQHISCLSDPNNREIQDTNIQRLIAGETMRSEVLNRHKDGSWRTISLLESKILLSDRSVGIVSVANDITEQKKSEAVNNALYHISTAVSTTLGVEEFIGTIQKELSNLLDVTNFYIGFYDENTDHITIPYFQDEQDNIDSFPAGKSLSAYVIRTGTPLLARREDLDQMSEQGLIQTVGAKALIWLGVPLKVKEKVIGIFAVQNYSDTNAYTQKDLEMMEFVAEQVGVFLERKKYEEDLVHALEKAEESDRLKSAFLANMSHEIRTPLNSIMGFAELLDEEDLEADDKAKYAATIIKSGQRLLRIINDILDLSKIEAGITQISYEQVEIVAILKEMQEEFLPIVRNNNLDLILAVPPNTYPLILQTDQHRVKQILANLLQNSIRYTNKGSITIGCETKNRVVEFFVQDTGVGISKKMQERIFDRFIQLGKNHNLQDAGTGLGLAITKSLVEKLGGTIWLESVPQKGTTFYFTLPLI